MRSICLALALFAGTATLALSAEPGPACAPILKAMAKTLQTDHATVTLIDNRTSNGITAGGVNYLQIDGKWKVSGMSPRDNQQTSDENLRNAKSYTCQALPDSTVDGLAATSYKTHTVAEEAVVDSIVSISKATGLALRVDNTIDAGAGTKRSYSTRYSYEGVRAPAVQK